MTEITETIEDSVEDAQEDATVVDVLATLAVSALVGAVAAIGIPRVYRRIRNRKPVSLEVIETTATEV